MSDKDTAQERTLPEFRIRHLSDHGLADAQPKPPTGSSAAQSPSLFRMRSSSYDQLIKAQPGAVLTYPDPDDGELITVRLKTLKRCT